MVNSTTLMWDVWQVERNVMSENLEVEQTHVLCTKHELCISSWSEAS